MKHLPFPRTAKLRLLVLAALVVVVAAWPHGDATGSPPTSTVPPTTPTSAARTGASPASATPASTRTSRGTTASTGTATTESTATGATPEATTIPPGAAVLTLATLTVKGRAPMTGYERVRFGQAWADVDRNGCDTRNDVLRRDLTAYQLKAGTHGCLVLRGTLHDPYTGHTIPFVRGPGTSNAVQVDHVVALGDAWQKGAQRWTTERRTVFANDPLNLLAVDGPTNLRKSDGDAATWLPPRKSGRCAYVARQVSVKHKYGLSVTEAERDAMARVLQACPGQGLVKAGAIPLGGGSVVAAAPSPQPRQSSPVPLTGGGTDPRYDTCREANAHGFGPYRQGVDPEYDWYRDRDHDGLVCER
jgi:Protein of unknown function (DUF1524)/Excalibur calcium-binding domain